MTSAHTHYYDQDRYDRQTEDEIVFTCEIDGETEDTYGAEHYWACDGEALWTILYVGKRLHVCTRHAEGCDVIDGYAWERDYHKTAQEAYDALS